MNDQKDPQKLNALIAKTMGLNFTLNDLGCMIDAGSDDSYSWNPFTDLTQSHKVSRWLVLKFGFSYEVVNRERVGKTGGIEHKTEVWFDGLARGFGPTIPIHQPWFSSQPESICRLLELIVKERPEMLEE